MTGEPAQNREALGQRVRASLRKTEERTAGLRKANTRLLVSGMASSAGATLVAGITAAQGRGWHMGCLCAVAG